MKDRVTQFLIKSLTTQIAPMVYVMMGVSVVIGFCFSTGALVDNGRSKLFAAGAFIPSTAWGCMLFLVAGISLIGMITKHPAPVKTGSLFGFMLWLLATINLAYTHNYYGFLILGLFHTIFQGYVYLSSSLGVLEREALTNHKQ